MDSLNNAADKAKSKKTTHLSDLIDEARTEEKEDVSTKRFNVEIPEELHQAIKMQSVRESRTMKEVFLDAIELYLTQRSA